MTLEDDLYTLLSGTAAITALVGTRIYPVVRQQGTALPALVFWRVSGPRVYAHGGAAGLVNARIQVDCWAIRPDKANELAEAVRAALSAYSSGNIQASFMDNETALYEDETGEFCKSLDFRIWHGES